MPKVNFTDRLTVEMSWKLAAALTFGLISGATGAATWAYAFRDSVIQRTDERRDVKLQAYPTYSNIEYMFRGMYDRMDQMDQQRQAEYKDLRNRIESVRDAIGK